jgi:hypothetical protein
MATIKTIAHLNELTKDVTGDYYLQPEINKTLTMPDIIKRLEEREIATKNVNGEAFVQEVFNEIIRATLDGHNVVTSLFHTSIGIKGVVYAHDLGHHIPAEQVHVRIHLAQGVNVRATVKDSTVYVAEQPAPQGPVIQSVLNPEFNEPNTLNAGAMALIQGLRLAVRGDKTDEIGLYFTSVETNTVVRIPAGKLSPNQPVKLQFVLPPEITPGHWKVKVVTQASSNGTTFTKEVREYQYPHPVNVV